MGFLKSVIADVRPSVSAGRQPLRAHSSHETGISSPPYGDTSAGGSGMRPAQERHPSVSSHSPGSKMVSNQPEGTFRAAARVDTETGLAGKPSFSDGVPGHDDSIVPDPRSHAEKNLSAAGVQPLIDVFFNGDKNAVDDRDNLRSRSEDGTGSEDAARTDNGGAFAHEDVMMTAHSDEAFGKALADSTSTTLSAAEENGDNYLVKSIKDSRPLTREQEVSGPVQDAPDSGRGRGARKHESIQVDPEINTGRTESYQPAVASEVPGKDQSRPQESGNKGKNYEQQKKIFKKKNDMKSLAGVIEEKIYDTPAGSGHQGIRADNAKDSAKVMRRSQPPIDQPLYVGNEYLSRAALRQDEKDARATHIHSPAAPEVKIGQVDVFIESPRRAKPNNSPASRPSPSLSSRYFLRRP